MEEVLTARVRGGQDSGDALLDAKRFHSAAQQALFAATEDWVSSGPPDKGASCGALKYVYTDGSRRWIKPKGVSHEAA
jgi:hypothetical protein